MATNIWALDKAHTEINFKVKHMVISTVTGKIKDFDATVETENDDFTTAKVKFEASTASVDTGVEHRDNHLRSDDFFNAELYPKMTFESTGIEKKSDAEYLMHGNLTIRDITKPIELVIEFGGVGSDGWGNMRAGFEMKGKLNRKEFGLKWNNLTETGNLIVADEVKLEINAELVRPLTATV